MTKHVTVGTVNTQAKMQVREMRKTASYYVFKAGLYDVNGTAVEVRADGIYLVGNGDQVLKLEFQSTRPRGARRLQRLKQPQPK